MVSGGTGCSFSHHFRCVHHHLVFLLLHHHVVLLLFHHHLFLWFLEGIDVLVDNTDEVSEKSADEACNVKGDDNLLLSGGLDETNTVVTSGYGILLVKEHEVAGGPDSLECNTDDNKEACGEKSSSAGWSVLGEEHNNESGGNNKGCSKDNTGKNVPPVDIVVQELIEDLKENEKSDSKDNDANK